jgi:hypothetical protein
MSSMWERITAIRPDFGSVAHVVFGLLAALLYAEYLFTAIFLVKQLGDALLAGEDWAETSGDLVEYAIGLVAGLFLRVSGFAKLL